MTRMLYIKSSISALENRGGYRCHAVIDNPSDRIYHALSWLFAAASAFVYIIHLACSARGLRIANGMPPTCHLSPSEPDRNLIGTSPKGQHRITKRSIALRPSDSGLPTRAFKGLWHLSRRWGTGHWFDLCSQRK